MDIYTLALTQSIVNLLQVIVLLVQYRVIRAQRGMNWWVAGSLAWTLGSIFNCLRQAPGLLGPLAILANNLLFTAGLALLYGGVLYFFDRRPPRAGLVVLCAGVSLVAAYFTYVHPDLAVRRVNLSAALALLSFLTAHALFTARTPPLRLTANFLGAVFLANGLFCSLRALTPWTEAPLATGFAVSGFQIATYLLLLVASTLWTFGYIVMLNQQLLDESGAARRDFELIFQTNPDAVLITRLSDGYIVAVNEGFLDMTGFTRPEVTGQSTLGLEIWYDPLDRQKVVQRLTESGVCKNYEAVFRRKDGSLLNGSTSMKIFSLQGQAHVISVTQDITERIQTEAQKQAALEALRHSEQRYRLLAEHANDVIWTLTLERQLTYVSPSVFHLRGFTPEEILQQPLEHSVCPGSLAALEAGLRHILTEIESGQRPAPNFFELEQPRRDGTTLWTETSGRVMYAEAGQPLGLVCVTRDITERKRLQQELEYQAVTDVLTGIPNRRYFLQQAPGELKRAQRFHYPLALAVIDVDHLKEVNDRCGHAAGDQALQAFTRLCRQNIREVDLFARFGGDEFALLLPETDLNQARQVLERLRQAIAAQPFELDGCAFSVTISAGLTGLPDAGDRLDALLMRADQALYRAKARGRNRIEVQ